MTWARVKPPGMPRAKATRRTRRPERLREGAVAAMSVTALRIQYGAMSSIPSPKESAAPDWTRLVADSVKQYGLWHTYYKLMEARGAYPDDLSLRGYTEIVRNTIVREFLAHPKGMRAVA